MKDADLVRQVATLWPYLGFTERYEWARRVAWAVFSTPNAYNRWVEVVPALVILSEAR